MAINFETALGIHEKALYARAKRSEVLGSNMANVDTPGYKARDVDFNEVLGQAKNAAGNGVALERTSAGHIAASGIETNAGMSLKYRNPYQPSLDGNTVELHIEQAQFADNAVRYQATLTFLGGKLDGLKTALTGGR